MKKVAIIGIQGVPARYGGFESMVENILGWASSDIQYTVFCSSKDMPDKIKSYKNAELKYIPLHANGIQSIPYDIISMFKAISGYDTLLILGVSGCIVLPIIRLFTKSRIIVNIDGLEHRRQKWNGFAKWFLRKSEAIAVNYADVIIADNKGISDYVYSTYGKQSEQIAYGGNQAIRRVPADKQSEILSGYGLHSGKYAISICRIEPENNCHIALEAMAHSDIQFVFIGNWNNSKYGQELRTKYAAYKNIMMLDAIYDLDILYTLRANARTYIHGHSAGGSNPSLIEAMFFDCNIIAYDVIYNRATTGNMAVYYSDSAELERHIAECAAPNTKLKQFAFDNYTWEHISECYESLY